ncbi:MAG: glycosyltransferase [Deltaproteobacteria bacterium]|jgi:glycosyltransferase involved in cell wall biosynthesis|nr:glycosyltransferase [Deltaproteobacteria bacterium]
MRVALIHYWLVGMRGGEKVLESMCRLFPQADIYTHVLRRSAVSERILRHNIKTTFINRLPNAARWYQKYLPLMPLALEQLDLRGYDLVLSNESGPAKGVITGQNCLHICYCHSPMRYLWDFYQDYLESVGAVPRLAFRFFASRLRLWDCASAARVDHFIANSRNVAERIRKHWRRDAAVIHPPVDHARFCPTSLATAPQDAPYILLGQLVDYKRADLAVRAFNSSGRRLEIIGEGSQLPRLKALARRNIVFHGRLGDAETVRLLQEVRALIFPGEEDFGLTPLEAMSAGRPVVAYGRGGALETVKDGVTGLFFSEQTPESMNAAIDRLEANYAAFVPQVISEHAAAFDVSVFERKLTNHIEELLARWRGSSTTRFADSGDGEYA